MDMLDTLLREDSSGESWIMLLDETEQIIRDLYRHAFTHPSIALLLRRCGNVFVTGEEEAGKVTSSLMAMEPTWEEEVSACS